MKYIIVVEHLCQQDTKLCTCLRGALTQQCGQSGSIIAHGLARGSWWSRLSHFTRGSAFALLTLGSSGSRCSNKSGRPNCTINARWASGSRCSGLPVGSWGTRWTLLTRRSNWPRQSLEANEATVTLGTLFSSSSHFSRWSLESRWARLADHTRWANNTRWSHRTTLASFTCRARGSGLAWGSR